MMWVWAHEEPDHPPRRRVDDVQVAHPPPADQNATIFHIKALPSKPNNKRGDMTRQSRYGRGQRLFVSATPCGRRGGGI